MQKQILNHLPNQNIPRMELEVTNRNELYDDRIKNLLVRFEGDGYKEEKKILERWGNEKKINGKSLIDCYNILNFYCNYIRTINKPLKKVTYEDNSNYILKNYNNAKPKTISLVKSNLINLFKWFYEVEEKPECVKRFKTTIPRNQRSYKTPESLPTPEEMKKMLDVSDRMEACLISLLAEVGLRRAEALGIRLKNIVFDEYGCKISIEQSKTEKRNVRVVDSTPYIKSWLNEHPRRDDPESYLFVTRKRGYEGHPLTPNGSWSIIKMIQRKAGIKKSIYLHLFRTLAITNMIRQDFNREVVERQVGWVQGSGMSKIYVRLSNFDIDNMILEKKGINTKKTRDFKKNVLEPKKCPDISCNHINPSNVKFCEKCHRPLTIEVIEKIKPLMDIKDKHTLAFMKRSYDDPEYFEDYLKKNIDEVIKDLKLKNLISEVVKEQMKRK